MRLSDNRHVIQAFATHGSNETLGQTGLVIGFNSVWLFVALMLFYLVIRYGVVGREEAYLEQKFANVYLNYKSRVRRWL
jgi:protein-S-isoprenylcysteine O-methyltransferase Ste14